MAALFTSDDFSGGIGAWTFVDPLADCSAAGVGSSPDIYAQITLPSGTAHSLSSLNIPRLMKAANDVDFDVVLKPVVVPASGGQQYGLLFYEDADNWVACQIYNFSGTRSVYRESEIGGSSGNTFNAGSVNDIYLRMTRVGDEWHFYTSTNGSSWTSRGGAFTAAINIATAGIWAGNFDNSGIPAYVAEFDWIEDSDDLITDEDPAGGSPSTFRADVAWHPYG